MAVLCIILLAVCLMDYRYARIPNRLILLILFYGIWWHSRDGGISGLLAVVFRCSCILLLTYPLFKIGAVGAGDVKLYSVTAGCLSGQDIPCFLFYSLLISATISILKLITEQNGKERLGYLVAYLLQLWKERRLCLYFQELSLEKRACIRLSGPAFLSVLLHVGGVY